MDKNHALKIVRIWMKIGRVGTCGRASNMKRREFIKLIGGATVALPLAARAQPVAMSVIGFLHSGSADDQANLVAATRRGLKEAGYVEGQNLTIEYRWADGKYDRLPGQAAELLSRNVVLIIAAGGSDPAPVRAGIVESLNRPGGNVTGINMIGSTLEAKRLELLHDLVPQASMIGVLINPKYPAAKIQTQEVQDATARLGVGLLLRNASTQAELDTAFAAFKEQKADAVLACNDPFFGSQREYLAALALRHGLPAMSFRREFAQVGGLLSYGADFSDGYRQVGLYAGRILKGTKTTDLPVMQPTKFELVINLKTAKALGLTVAESFLLRADEVIE
jgi:putative ABC transport system substrate-binding protein